MEEMTWKEFLNECDVSHWTWSGGSDWPDGSIIEANPTEDLDFCTKNDVVDWGRPVKITDEIGTGYVVLETNRLRNGEYHPLNGAVFASHADAEEYRKNNKSD